VAGIAELFDISPESQSGLAKLLDRLTERTEPRIGYTPRSEEPAEEAADPRERWLALDPADRSDQLTGALAHLITGVLGRSEGLIDTSSPLLDVGLTSVMVLEVREQVRRLTGVTVPAGAIYDLETVSALAQFVSEHLDD
jgi:acyl carrier protein